MSEHLYGSGWADCNRAALIAAARVALERRAMSRPGEGDDVGRQATEDGYAVRDPSTGEAASLRCARCAGKLGF